MEFEGHEAGMLSPDGTDMYVTTQGSGDITAEERGVRAGRRKGCSEELTRHGCSTQELWLLHKIETKASVPSDGTNSIPQAKKKHKMKVRGECGEWEKWEWGIGFHQRIK